MGSFFTQIEVEISLQSSFFIKFTIPIPNMFLTCVCIYIVFYVSKSLKISFGKLHAKTLLLSFM